MIPADRTLHPLWPVVAMAPVGCSGRVLQHRQTAPQKQAPVAYTPSSCFPRRFPSSSGPSYRGRWRTAAGTGQRRVKQKRNYEKHHFSSSFHRLNCSNTIKQHWMELFGFWGSWGSPQRNNTATLCCFFGNYYRITNAGANCLQIEKKIFKISYIFKATQRNF